jgi:tetratricopeptide (TPR) repeat protein
MKTLSSQQVKLLSEHLQQGQRAIQLGAFSEAEKQFLAVLKINPNMIEAQAGLAFSYVASKQHEKASAQLKLILKSNPNHAQTHYNLANSLYEQKLYEEAIKHHEAAIKLNTSFVDAHIHCGIACRMLKNYDAAIACLHKALDLDKANARAFHVLGMVYADIEDYSRALHCLESATGLAPNHAEFRVSFANVLEKAKLDLEAGLQYHQACEANPNYLDGFTLYGAHLLKNHRHDEALECFNWASQLAPKNLNVMDYLGNAYLGMSDTDAALKQFDAALNIEPNRVSSLIGKEQAYQDVGNSDAAVALCDAIIAIDPKKPAGHLLKVSINKSKQDDTLAEDLLPFVEDVNLDVVTKTSVHFALGKIYDDQNNFKEAFNYYLKGNALKNKHLNFDCEDDEATCSELIAFFNKDFFAQHTHLGVKSNLPVVIVGMPRSGTTLTEQIISSHPDVIGAGEVAFWTRSHTAMPLRLDSAYAYPDCTRELTVDQAKDISQMYETTLRKIVGSNTQSKHITDKMPHNFLYLGLIALLFPNVKIIHTKRDPIDTCLSIFFQNFTDTHNYAFNLSNLGFHYKQYQRLMQHWHEVLPGRILDINYEDTIADPEFWSRKLIAHIGLEWNEACLSPHKLERSVKTASHWQVRQPIYKTSVQRWKNYEEFLSPLIQALND